MDGWINWTIIIQIQNRAQHNYSPSVTEALEGISMQQSYGNSLFWHLGLYYSAKGALSLWNMWPCNTSRTLLNMPFLCSSWIVKWVLTPKTIKSKETGEELIVLLDRSRPCLTTSVCLLQSRWSTYVIFLDSMIFQPYQFKSKCRRCDKHWGILLPQNVQCFEIKCYLGHRYWFWLVLIQQTVGNLPPGGGSGVCRLCSGLRCHRIPVVVPILGCYERQMVLLWRSDHVPTC